MADKKATHAELMTAVENCIATVRTANALRSVYSDAGDAFAPCINEALSPLLQMLSNLLSEAEFKQTNEYAWFDFGLEPMNRREAESQLESFLDQLERTLQMHPIPYTCAYIRAATFAIEFELDDESSSP